MANLIQMSEQLKAVPDQWLEQQIQSPSGMVPPYLALSELNRRKALRSQAAQPPSNTVAESVVQAQPAPPPMASVDVLNNRQPMPQLPQTPQAGIPSPLPQGLASLAPPAPQGPPAPQRMAVGGLVSSIMPGEWDWMEEDRPWWQRALGHYGMTGGLMGIAPSILAGLFAYRRRGKGVDEGGATDPAAGAPAPAPTGKAAGGPIRLAGGGTTTGLNWAWWDQPHRSRQIMREETDEGTWLRTPQGDVLFKKTPQLNVPEWKKPDPIRVESPDFGKFLEQVKAATAQPEGYVSPLEGRIAALERRRDEIRRPNTRDALIETGLGLMASKSSYPLQALGESGYAMLQNRRARQDAADRQELAIDDRLAGIEAAREQQRQAMLRADVQAAQEMVSRQHGANITEAQLRGQQEASERAWELEKARVLNQQLTGQHAQDAALSSAMLNSMTKEPPGIDPLSPEGVAARMKIDENQARQHARFRRDTDGYGMPSWAKHIMTGPELENTTKGALSDYSKWSAMPGETFDHFWERFTRIRSQQVAGGDGGWKEAMPNPWNRGQLATRIATYGSDPSNKEERAYYQKVRSWFDKVQEEFAKNAPKAGQQVKTGSGVRTITP